MCSSCSPIVSTRASHKLRILLTSRKEVAGDSNCNLPASERCVDECTLRAALAADENEWRSTRSGSANRGLSYYVMRSGCVEGLRVRRAGMLSDRLHPAELSVSKEREEMKLKASNVGKRVHKIEARVLARERSLHLSQPSQNAACKTPISLSHFRRLIAVSSVPRTRNN